MLDDSLVRRFVRELIPTGSQIFLTLILSAGILTAANLYLLFPRLHITSAGVSSSSATVRNHLDFVLNSSLAGNLTLILFWAVVGLVAYLICWLIFSLIVAARNEVTVETAYTNRGHWRGPWGTLVLKFAGAMILLAMLMLAAPGVVVWINQVSPFFSLLTFAAFPAALIAVIGLALQLYMVLFAAQLTFSPWYRPQAFTE